MSIQDAVSSFRATQLSAQKQIVKKKKDDCVATPLQSVNKSRLAANFWSTEYSLTCLRRVSQCVIYAFIQIYIWDIHLIYFDRCVSKETRFNQLFECRHFLTICSRFTHREKTHSLVRFLSFSLFFFHSHSFVENAIQHDTYRPLDGRGTTGWLTASTQLIVMLTLVVCKSAPCNL